MRRLAPLLLVATVACSSGVTTTGVITEYTPAGETAGSITLLSAGALVTFVVSPDTDLEFPPTHIQEHRLNGEPVAISWVEENGVQKATAIRDG